RAASASSPSGRGSSIARAEAARRARWASSRNGGPPANLLGPKHAPPRARPHSPPPVAPQGLEPPLPRDQRQVERVERRRSPGGRAGAGGEDGEDGQPPAPGEGAPPGSRPAGGPPPVP